MDRIVSARRPARRHRAAIGSLIAGFLAFAASSRLGATSIVPLSDPELYRRADVVVHGIVTSSDVTVDSLGRPETVSIIEPLAVLKGKLSGSLVLHQLGGTLPDGRFFKMWGRPEYPEGREVVVFAIARSGGEYETAEMLLGKFEVNRDEANTAFAVADLASGSHPGVDVHADEEDADADGERTVRPAARRAAPFDGAVTVESAVAPRSLAHFLASLRRGVFPSEAAAAPVGKLTPVEHVRTSRVMRPLWGNISNFLYRWNNLASATWTISGTANMDGGGLAEAQGALDAWTNDSHSNINYISGSSSSNVLYLNATSSVLGCGWSTCLSGAGVIGCGGPGGAGGNTWRGDSYSTIGGGTVELRAYCSHNGYSSVTTEAVLQHELGHTLGLGHSDQNISAHDVCRGDEDSATMRSVVQNRATLGTDDVDAIRWIYGDGLNSCTAAGPAKGDFDGDGKSDLVWRHNVTGTTSLWLMNGTSVASAVSLPLVSDTGWRIVGSADFDGDGKTDLLWRHSVSGASAIWLMNGTAISSVVSLPLVSDTNWKIVATADFNADGKTDIVWRHDGTGASAIWLMNGTALSSNVSLPGVSDTGWKIVGAGDFNADGKPDLVWRHSVSGANSVWYMNGTTLSSTVFLPSISDSSWRIGGVADYNGDGKPDLVWRHVVQGLNGIWLMNGVSISSSVGLPLVTDTGWEIVGPR